jgi:hypothetical protein
MSVSSVKLFGSRSHVPNFRYDRASNSTLCFFFVGGAQVTGIKNRYFCIGYFRRLVKK